MRPQLRRPRSDRDVDHHPGDVLLLAQAGNEQRIGARVAIPPCPGEWFLEKKGYGEELKLKRPLNVLAWPGLPARTTLERLGVRRLSAGTGIALAAHDRTYEAARALIRA